MTAYVIPLSDPQATFENVGGKGMSLAKIIQTEFPVPDDCQVTTDAYRAFVDANNLLPKILAAREYGIPPVPATGNGTRRIQDGQTIIVDGSAGIVSLN